MKTYHHFAGNLKRSPLNSNNQQVKVGLSQRFPCSYLDNQNEQLLVIQDEVNDEIFERLLRLGFRRSGQSIYKPRCPTCQACEAIRVLTEVFSISKSQKRILKKNSDTHIKISNNIKTSYYPLYEKYINLRHQDGNMYPPTKEQFTNFLAPSWLPPKYIELYLGDKLIAVAVTDFLPQSLSAVYTFFDPNEEKRSLGSLMILKQCELAKELKKPHLYLGFQIENNCKMSYKKNYTPFEKLTATGWQ